MTVSPFMNVAATSNPDTNRHALYPVAELTCELVRGTEEQVLDQVLDQWMPRVRQTSVALDVSQVERIDAAGIAVLITLHCAAIEAGNNFSVINPSARVLELLRLVGLESILVPVKTHESGRKSDLARSAA